jgi:hypothetical protein
MPSRPPGGDPAWPSVSLYLARGRWVPATNHHVACTSGGASGRLACP